MSDDEYNSDINSGSEDSDNDIVIPSTKKHLFKPSINIKSYTKSYNDIDIDDSEPDDADPEEEEDDEEKIIGGADEINSEDELSEKGEVKEPEDDDDDAEPEDDDDDDEEDSDIEIDEDGEPIQKVLSQKTKGINKSKKHQLIIQDEDEDEDEDEYDENYLQKFDNEIIKNYVNEFHPECLNHNYEEIQKLSIVTKNSNGIIIDPLHRTIPYLTKYERARILGQRAKQIETGAKPLVNVPENIVDSYIISELELREKRIPFIIRRPIPGGACEYWNLKDLEVIAF
jgi:DNA-directed RNA polymerase I, II, and III subunit RPABC2